MTTAEPYIGRPLPRVEDLRLITGEGSYAADINREGQLYARIVRSDVPFGRLNGVDADVALARPGVVFVMTADDIDEHRIPIRILSAPAGEAALQTPLTGDFVRYVGDPVAVVVAEDPYLAEDAAEDVVLDIEPLPAVVEPSEAVADGAPLLFPDLGTNVVGVESATDGEDVDALLADAAVVVRKRFRVQRHGSVPLEPRGLVAEWEPDLGRVSLWGAAKVKHFNRKVLAGMLDMDVESVRMIEGDVGGGFGARGEFYPEDFLIPWLAIKLERPIKWVEDRRENLLALNHSREHDFEIEASAAADGTLLGFRAQGSFNQGGYVRTHGGQLLPRLTVNHLPGAYRWRGFEIECAAVVTNKTPAGTYRGPGQSEPTFMRERMLDILASELGMDPVELRRKNLIAAEEMPYAAGIADIESGEEVLYPLESDPLAFEALLNHVSYEKLRADIDARRAAGETVGVGVAIFMEMDNPGTFEQGRIVMDSEGGFTAHVGVGSVGQGVRTVLTQVVADMLEVPMEGIEISHHDTSVIPEGQGAFSSRATVWGGQALAGAAVDLIANARLAAADRLEVAEADLDYHDGSFQVRGVPGREVSLAELDEVSGKYRYAPPPGSELRQGANIAVIELDPRSGGVKVLQYAMSYAIGKAINPLTADGQVVGAIAQGVGGALLEDFAYSPEGQPLATSFMDYAMATAVEVPPIDVLLLEDEDAPPDDPLRGAKGLGGGGGILGTSGAIANAVADALGAPGRDLTTTPISPELVQLLATPAE